MKQLYRVLCCMFSGSIAFSPLLHSVQAEEVGVFDKAFSALSQEEQTDSIKRSFQEPSSGKVSKGWQRLHAAFLEGGYSFLFDEKPSFAPSELFLLQEQALKDKKKIATLKGELGDQENFLLYYAALFAEDALQSAARDKLKELDLAPEDLDWQEAIEGFERAGAKAVKELLASGQWLKGTAVSGVQEQEAEIDLVKAYEDERATLFTEQELTQMQDIGRWLSEVTLDDKLYKALLDEWKSIDFAVLEQSREDFLLEPTEKAKDALLEKERRAVETLKKLYPQFEQAVLDTVYQELITQISSVMRSRRELQLGNRSTFDILKKSFESARAAKDAQVQLDVLKRIEEFKDTLVEKSLQKRASVMESLQEQASYVGSSALGIRKRTKAKKKLKALRRAGEEEEEVITKEQEVETEARAKQEAEAKGTATLIKEAKELANKHNERLEQQIKQFMADYPSTFAYLKDNQLETKQFHEAMMPVLLKGFDAGNYDKKFTAFKKQPTIEALNELKKLQEANFAHINQLLKANRKAFNAFIVEQFNRKASYDLKITLAADNADYMIQQVEKLEKTANAQELNKAYNDQSQALLYDYLVTLRPKLGRGIDKKIMELRDTFDEIKAKDVISEQNRAFKELNKQLKDLLNKKKG